MAVITISTKFPPVESSSRWSRYRLAAVDLLADQPFDGLTAFRAESELPGRSSDLSLDDQPEPEAVRTTAGWVGGELRQVRAWQAQGDNFLDVSGIGMLAVSSQGDWIQLVRREQDASPVQIQDALLGPGLSLALARHGIWCVHAGAALYMDQLVLFMGESGRGKSTLSGYLGSQAGSGWRIAGDDILPLELSIDGLYARLHFPQPKYPPERQPSSGLPECLPVSAIYVLAAPLEAVKEIDVTTLSQVAGSLALVRHTVASRLFDPALLAEHLEFCSQAAGRVTLRQLEYPRQFDQLPALQRVLEANLHG